MASRESPLEMATVDGNGASTTKGAYSDLPTSQPTHQRDSLDPLEGSSSGSRSIDLEAQSLVAEKQLGVTVPSTPLENSQSTRAKLWVLAGYLSLNLLLTIYNKKVLGGFAFPYLLTTLHTSFTAFGCFVLMQLGWFKLTSLSWRENGILTAFSVLFTLNIAISNVSLHLVSVPFHQIMRSTTPVFAIAIYRTIYNRTYSSATYLTMIPLIAGVVLAAYGDIYFTPYGFSLTLLGVILAAVKTIVTNQIMTGSLKLPALEILIRMCPLAAVQSIFLSFVTGEGARFVTFQQEGNLHFWLVLALLGNGFLALVLNLSSFHTNKLAGALTMTVAGNVKQVLTILVGIALFNVHVGFLNGLGMAIATAGAAWYSKVELDSKGRK